LPHQFSLSKWSLRKGFSVYYASRLLVSDTDQTNLTDNWEQTVTQIEIECLLTKVKLFLQLNCHRGFFLYK